MPENRPQPLGRHTSGVRQVNLVVEAVETQSLLDGEVSHGLYSRVLGVVGPDVEHLHALALVDRLQPDFGHRRVLPLGLQRGDGLIQVVLTDEVGGADHDFPPPRMFGSRGEILAVAPPEGLQGADLVIAAFGLASHLDRERGAVQRAYFLAELLASGLALPVDGQVSGLAGLHQGRLLGRHILGPVHLIQVQLRHLLYPV